MACSNPSADTVTQAPSEEVCQDIEGFTTGESLTAFLTENIPSVTEYVLELLDPESFLIFREVSQAWNNIWKEAVTKNLLQKHREHIKKIDLCEAARKGWPRVASILISRAKGANIHILQYHAGDFSTPLFYAARNGHIEVAKILLANGAEVNDLISLDWSWTETPLHAAVWYGHFEMVQLLLKWGANVNARGRFFRFGSVFVPNPNYQFISPLELAKRMKNQNNAIVCLLEARGGKDEQK